MTGLSLPMRIEKYAALALVLALLGWCMLPKERAPGKDAGGSPKKTDATAKYSIRVAIGQTYMPGTVPMGIGKEIRGMADVVAAFEQRFPDTHIELITVPFDREYLVTQLSSGSAPDIVNVNVEDVWTDVQKGWYLALDPWLERPNPFIREKGDPARPGYEKWWDMFKYQAISRGKAAPDQLMYCLSYDMIETGIFYNKDLFRKAGVEVPNTWEKMLDGMAKLEKSGVIPMTIFMDCFNDWGTDLIFDQLYNSLLPGIDLLQDPLREPYLQGYLDWDEICFLFQKGFFTQRDARYRDVFRIMKELRRYCGPPIVDPTLLINDFVKQRAAMHWNTSQLVYRLMADKDLGFEWGVFYLPTIGKQTSQYASANPMCVIGGSANQLEVTNTAFADTGDPKTSKRLERVMAFLQFMCVPEQYTRVVNEYPCFISNIVGVDSLPVLQPFVEILEKPYTTTKWIFTFDLRFGDIQRRLLELYLNGAMDLDTFMRWQEDNLRTAIDNLMLRKPMDMAKMQARWDELAPARAEMEDLPSGL